MSTPLPLSRRVSFVFPGVMVTVRPPAGAPHLMLRALTVTCPLPARSRGDSIPNTFWLEQCSEPLALILRPDTVLPWREVTGSPPAMIRFLIALQSRVGSDD